MEKRKVLGTIIGVLAFIALIAGISFAWFSWQSSNNTLVSFTVGGVDITFDAGADITSSKLRPVSTKEVGVSKGYAVKKTITASSALTAYLNLYLTLETLPDGLKHESFIWELYKGSNLIGKGNFKNNNQGDKITIASNQKITSTTSTYDLYIWIDGNNYDNPETMQNQTFKFVLSADATDHEPTGADYITSLVSSNPDTMNNDDPDGNVRYMGADPNNYVRFNNELWRIIGVFDVASTYGGPTEKRLKIIRDEPIGSMEWDDSDVNDWTQASLQEYLNGEYYNNLSSETKSLIGDAIWNLGGTASNGLPSHFYGYERGTTVYSGRPTYWVGKVGLMYPSDYGYATSGGTTNNRTSCLTKEMIIWLEYSDCNENDYLSNSDFEQWTITPDSSIPYGVFALRVLYIEADDPIISNSVSPVLYLKSTVEITGGEGTSGNPYTLS